MNETFTPGPWSVETTLRYGVYHWREIVSAEHGVVGEVYSGEDADTPADDEADANAHLIAAAPDLFAAGEVLAKVADDKMATVRETVEAVRVMRAALSRARGETA